MNLTVFESVDAALAGVVDAEIDAWLQQFLRGEGDNVALAEGLLAQRRFYLGPVLYPLTHLQRCCGPEPDIEFPVHADRWVAKTTRMQRALADAWEAPPLVVMGTSIRDGNHRYAALTAAGRRTHPVIFVFDDSDRRSAFAATARRPD